MTRREFITLLAGAAAMWPRWVRAQQTVKVWRIGYLAGVSRSAASGSYAAFVQGMRELGYIEEKDFVIEWRSVEGRYERFPEIAAEPVRLKVDVFVTGVTAALPALKRATNAIPIVMAYSTDPVGNGLVGKSRMPSPRLPRSACRRSWWPWMLFFSGSVGELPNLHSRTIWRRCLPCANTLKPAG